MLKRSRYLCASLVILLLCLNNSSAQRRFGTDRNTAENSQQQKDNSTRRFGLNSSNRSSGSLRYFPTITTRRYGFTQVGEANTELAHYKINRTNTDGFAAQLARAEKFVEDDQPDKAIEIYRKLLTTKSNLDSVHAGLGYALIQTGEYENAIKELYQALLQNPQNSAAKLNYGVALFRSGAIKDAIKHYQELLANNRENLRENLSAIYFNLAVAYAHQGDFDNAITNYQAAIAQKKHYPAAYNNLALIYEVKANFAEAKREILIAIEQCHGDYAIAHYNLARLYINEKRYAEAIQEFQIAIKQQPDFAEAYLDLGNVYLIRAIVGEIKELDLAINAYNRALALRNDDYAIAHENLAIALSRLNRKKDAFTQYRIAVEQSEIISVETLRNLISTIKGKNNFLLTNELSRSENSSNLIVERDLKKFAMRMNSALELYEELEESDIDNADIYYCVGRAYAAAGNWPAAINQYTKALTLSQNRDQEAQSALIAVLELVQYY